MGAYHKPEQGSPHEAEQPPSDPSTRATRVLLVEDERLIRMALKHELDALGYEVECAADGNEAARIIASRRDPIDLLLTDIVVPGPSGPEVAELARARWPSTRVLFMSAYPRELLLQQGRIKAGQITLEKPFTDEQLASRMRELLESA